MEGVEPSWPKPPVSETGAYTEFRHIRMKASRAGSAARRVVSCGRPPRGLPEIACGVEARLTAGLELHDLRRARRCGMHRAHTVEMAMHLVSSRWDGRARRPPLRERRVRSRR